MEYRNKGNITLLQNQYTYIYIAQVPGSGSPNAYGTDTYSGSQYSCSSTNQICLAGGPGAPNTGFFSKVKRSKAVE